MAVIKHRIDFLIMSNSTELKPRLLRAFRTPFPLRIPTPDCGLKALSEVTGISCLWHELTDVYHFVTHIRQIVSLDGQIVAI